MMKRAIILVIFSLILLTTVCYGQDSTASNEFGLELIKKLPEDVQESGWMLSPMAIFDLLSAVAFAANENFKVALKNFAFKAIQYFDHFCFHFIKNKDSKRYFKIYVDNQFSMKDNIAQSLRKVKAIEKLHLSCDHLDGPLQIINNWLTEKTGNKGKALIADSTTIAINNKQLLLFSVFKMELEILQHSCQLIPTMNFTKRGKTVGLIMKAFIFPETPCVEIDQEDDIYQVCQIVANSDHHITIIRNVKEEEMKFMNGTIAADVYEKFSVLSMEQNTFGNRVRVLLPMFTWTKSTSLKMALNKLIPAAFAPGSLPEFTKKLEHRNDTTMADVIDTVSITLESGETVDPNCRYFFNRVDDVSVILKTPFFFIVTNKEDAAILTVGKFEGDGLVP